MRAHRVMAEWRDLCLSEEVEKLILDSLQGSELSGRMLAGIQRQLVTRTDEGAGLVSEVAADFIRHSGSVCVCVCVYLKINSSSASLSLPISLFLSITGFEVELKNLVYHQLDRL